MINIMRWLYELFNVDQIRIIFVSMFSSLLAYLTPTKGFLIALVVMFGFNIWCGMRADGVSIIRCKNFKWDKFKNALVELLLYLIIIEVVFSFMTLIGDGENSLLVIKTITYVFSYVYLQNAFTKALQINQFIGNELHYTRGKTKIPVTVPLSDPARYIYEYYRAGRTKGNLFMNLPTDQDINRVLKTIAGKVGITKDISSKTGRHTFATLYYKKTHDIVTLSHLLGHSSITMTMVYAHALEDEREAGIHAFDDML